MTDDDSITWPSLDDDGSDYADDLRSAFSLQSVFSLPEYVDDADGGRTRIFPHRVDSLGVQPLPPLQLQYAFEDNAAHRSFYRRVENYGRFCSIEHTDSFELFPPDKSKSKCSTDLDLNETYTTCESPETIPVKMVHPGQMT